MTAPHYITATIPQRVGAWLADGLLFIALVATPSVLISWWSGPSDFTSCTFVGNSEVCDITPEALRYTRIVFYSLSTVFILIYSVFVGRGATIGKRSTESMIVDVRTGEPIGFARGLLRTVCIASSVLPLGAGFLIALGNRQRRTLHDYIAGSRVISP